MPLQKDLKWKGELFFVATIRSLHNQKTQTTLLKQVLCTSFGHSSQASHVFAEKRFLRLRKKRRFHASAFSWGGVEFSSQLGCCCSANRSPICPSSQHFEAIHCFPNKSPADPVDPHVSEDSWCQNSAVMIQMERISVQCPVLLIWGGSCRSLRMMLKRGWVDLMGSFPVLPLKKITEKRFSCFGMVWSLGIFTFSWPPKTCVMYECPYHCSQNLIVVLFSRHGYVVPFPKLQRFCWMNNCCKRLTHTSSVAWLRRELGESGCLIQPDQVSRWDDSI